MAEILYIYEGDKALSSDREPRWLGVDELDTFNEHLALCGQKPLGQNIWDRAYAEGTMYCLIFENGQPVARACVEKYSEDKWEVSDVRVAKEYRNRGLAYDACVFVLDYILENGRHPTIRTEEDNIAMRRVIAGMGFRPMDQASAPT